MAGFSSMALRNALWGAARATTPNEFTFRMKELEKLNIEAFKWLNKKHPSEWSRSHFNFRPTCDTLLNNICECFNAYILDARELSIVSMLESIRTLVMSRILSSKVQALQWSGSLCPRNKQILGKNMHDAASCIVHKSDDDNYEIITMLGAQYKVDLKCKSCSCRKQELSGIPCVHSCAAIHMMMGDCESFVHPCYTIDSYLRSYDHNIKPLNGIAEWPVSDRIPLLPPMYIKPKRGRPSKKRRRNADGGPSKKLGRSNVMLHCRKCRQSCHNSTTCEKRTNNELTGSPIQLEVRHEDTLQVSQQLIDVSNSAVQPETTLEIPTQRSSNSDILSVMKSASKLAFIIAEKQYARGLDGSIPVLVKSGDWMYTAEEIDDLFLGDAEVWRRPTYGKTDPLGGDFPVVTKEGHHILDVIFTSPILDLAKVGENLDQINGVVDHGVISGIPCTVIIAAKNGVLVVDNLS